MASRNQKRPSTDVDEGLGVGKKQKQTPKRPKNTKTSFAQQPDSGVDASGHPYWQLSNSNRRVTIQDYSETTYVHIREVYNKDGNEAYGKRVPILSPHVHVFSPSLKFGVYYPCDN
jgi:hypothetical protein